MRSRKPTQPPDPYRQALGLLVRREHSRRELGRKLDARGIDPTAAEAVLDTLEGQGYQDDGRFAEMLVRSRISGGYGPLYIRAELGMHGIESQIAASVLDQAAPDWTAIAADAARRRFGARPAADRAEMLKRAHYLHRRGFPAEAVRSALNGDIDLD